MSFSIDITADVAQAGQQIDRFSKDARIALTNLSLVVQDLPYGFIGIQNNLPYLAKSFNELKVASGGTLNALKTLGQSLVGPAGLYLAFSAVTSVVTLAVQEYGSIGNAVDALISTNTELYASVGKLEKSYRDFNEELKTTEQIQKQAAASVDGEIAKIDALVAVIKDQKSTYDEINSAKNQLKDINKDFFGSLDVEKGKFEELDTAVKNYKDSLIQAAITKAFQQQIGETSVELSKQQELLNKIQSKIDEFNAAPKRLVGKEAREDIRPLKELEKIYNKQNLVVQELTTRKKELTTAIYSSIDAENALRAPIDAAIALQKKKEQAEKDALKSKKKNVSQSKKIRDQEIREEEKAERERLASNDRIAKFRAKQLEAQAAKNRETARLQRQKDAAAELIAFDKQAQQQLKDSAEIDPLAALNKTIGDIGRKANLDKAIQIIDQTFFLPLSNAFEQLLTDTDFTFKEFGKIILQALSKLVAQVIATGIIQLITTILTGGFSTGISAGLNAVIKGTAAAFGFSTGLPAPSRVAAPSFSSIGTSGMNMTGSVNLVLRGSDLVGAINRTNTTINRVG